MLGCQDQGLRRWEQQSAEGRGRAASSRSRGEAPRAVRGIADPTPPARAVPGRSGRGGEGEEQW